VINPFFCVVEFCGSTRFRLYSKLPLVLMYLILWRKKGLWVSVFHFFILMLLSAFLILSLFCWVRVTDRSLHLVISNWQNLWHSFNTPKYLFLPLQIHTWKSQINPHSGLLWIAVIYLIQVGCFGLAFWSEIFHLHLPLMLTILPQLLMVGFFHPHLINM